jgi:hypothetical protein
MPIVTFLIGITAERRHHSQVRIHPWATFFNGDIASTKLTAATLQGVRVASAVSTARRRASARDSFLKTPLFDLASTRYKFSSHCSQLPNVSSSTGARLVFRLSAAG